MTHNCKKCGSNRPAKFEMPSPGTLADVNVRCFCGWCGILIKAVYMTEVPFYTVSKLKVWGLTKNLDLIARAKNEIKFREDAQGLQKNIQYWNLYSQVVRLAAS